MCNIKIKRRNEKENGDSKKIQIFVLGNPLLKEDYLPLKLIPILQKKFPQINFLEFDPTEDLFVDDIILLDVVEGIDNVKIINDLSKIETRKIYSTHDFDAAFLLKLLKKLKLIKKATIIGIPKNAKEKDVLKELEEKIKKLLAEIKIANK
ncbi:MAG: hypothetical protein QW480_00115 [Candidatus Aenigmatarchaeota archaeon]